MAIRPLRMRVPVPEDAAGRLLQEMLNDPEKREAVRLAFFLGWRRGKCTDPEAPDLWNIRLSDWKDTVCEITGIHL